MASKSIHSVGKRKTSIARVWVSPGTGKIQINKRTLDQYYIRSTSKMMITQPFELTGTSGKYDVTVNVTGGGLSGQAGAIRHALCKALVEINPEARAILKPEGLLTRDSRKKERKLYGLKSARARFQFSKR